MFFYGNSNINSTLASINITGNPNILNYKLVFRNESVFYKQLNTIHFTKDVIHTNTVNSTSYNVNIPHHGDLLSNIYLEFDITCKNNGTATYTVNHFLNSFISECEFLIGGTCVQRYEGEWKQMKDELTESHTNSHLDSYIQSASTGGNPTLLNFISDINKTTFTNNQKERYDMPIIVGGIYNDTEIAKNVSITKKLIYKFDFWFSRSMGTALPLNSINHNLRLKFKLNGGKKYIGDTSLEFSIDNFDILGEYIYLPQSLRNKFNPDKILIEQIQRQLLTTPSELDTTTETSLKEKIYEVTFYKPVKYIVWAIKNEGTPGSNKGQGPCYFTSQTTHNLYGSDGAEGYVSLNINGQYYFKNTSMVYFTRIYPSQYGSIPSLDRIGIYSFASNPFDHSPSGYLDFTDVKHTQLTFKFANNTRTSIVSKDLLVYAVNYNILSINNKSVTLMFRGS